MSRCAGAGREHSQAAQAGQGKYSVPQMLCSVYEWGLARGQGPFSPFHEFESYLAWSANFSGSLVFFESFTKFRIFRVL